VDHEGNVESKGGVMAGENDQEWMPKTRDDWTGIFADGYKKAKSDLRSEEEEAAAKAKENENTADTDQDGKGGGSGNGGSGSKRKSVAERLLGL
jgi:hypothetical protein